MSTSINRSSHSGYFQGKTVIITGSSRGIGRAAALEFLKAGARVVINGRRPDSVKRTCDDLGSMGYEVMGLTGDVSDNNFCRELIHQTIERFGKIDILINNAGGGFRGSIEETSAEVMRSVIDSNLMSAIYCTKAALEEIKRNRGSIVFISSLSGIRGMPMNAPYCIAKMGLTAFAETLKIELARTGAHIGLLMVGWTDFDVEKRVTSADGTLIPINRKSMHSREQVARIILNTIKKRRFRVVLTPIGIFLDLFHRISPALTEWVIKRSEKVESFNK